MPKITSVVQLAKYKVGDTLYWVTIRPVGSPGIVIPEGDEWIRDCHPKVMHDYGMASKTWKYRGKVPRLHAIDFQYVVDLLTSEPIVERFVIAQVERSFDTGEFYYCNGSGEWMPESFLYQKPWMAKREKARIKGLFRQWSSQMSEDEV